VGGCTTAASRRVEDGGDATLVVVVDEVASQSVRTEAGRVERPTHLRLVLGMTDQRPQLDDAVSELALVAVAARAVLLELPTQLRLVAGRVHHHHRRTLRRRLLRPVQQLLTRYVTR